MNQGPLDLQSNAPPTELCPLIHWLPAEEVGHDHVQYIFAELAHILDYDFNVKF